MKVVTIAAAKGGATKSTVTALLAVRATRGDKRVAIFDLNGDQGDLTQWYALRGKPRRGPNFLRLIPVQKISLDIEVCRAEGFDWAFMDTPPSELDVIDNAILKSDAVVIPVRPSIFDIQSVTPIFETRIRYLQAYITAVAQGKTGPEVDKSLQTEVDSLWDEVQQLAATAEHPTAKGRRAS